MNTVVGTDSDRNVLLVQLPFPSQEDPLPLLSSYYHHHGKRYAEVFPEYAVKPGDLWEAPLWVAHLDGAIDRHATEFLDLSSSEFDPGKCSDRIGQRLKNGTHVFLSPLAQNFSLAVDVSARLMSRGARTVIGGNMADLASPGQFSHVYNGLVKKGIYDEITGGLPAKTDKVVRLGRSKEPLGYLPSYRHLQGFGARVPLVRVHASHGCLFACAFCGDAWSRQLHVVEPSLLAQELAELRTVFPDTRIMYVGDKTFGQSSEAVENLKKVISRDAGYRLIVQSHVSVITPKLVDDMLELGVEVVEIGFETASSTVLDELRKHGGPRVYEKAISLLNSRGLRVILNVLGGLPNETRESQLATIAFIEETASEVWLYNLYNFVPYPKTPLFSSLRPRIVDWDFKNWREDRPVVFEPYHLSRAQAWDHFLALVELTTGLIARPDEVE